MGTVIATTASGSNYVISMDPTGVRWFRIPSEDSRAPAAAGWEAAMPRVVPGERLLLGDMRSTPVVKVAFLPGPEPPQDWVPVPPTPDVVSFSDVLAWISRRREH